ncbi:ribosomal protein S19 [Neocallimastix lanati (nom. inval.)]|jgi:small subunit ribosomal protein S19e|uniref:Ribosomal protein S19 n=1 Tax=Neocallimastix californiae TaxID=1754190 RepID=A0A1Y2AF32_9FUNG|nr:ribosomal protein S19 [Neocallimastix sp. JGI-2020a]ORY21189.1 ribosomal protein S19 [Neocallimastix californiae]|eukprot:ORY21189.1 ribosomal protein S19 [Neocallimastix californiae]
MVKEITVKDINSQVFVKAYAAHLKKSGEMTSPKYVDRRKASIRKYSINENDLYYIKAASVARHFYLRSNVGIGGLCKSNSGLSRHSVHTPNASYNPTTATGNTIRKIIENFEEMGILEKDYYGGRRLSQKGRKSLDSVAIQIFQENGYKD